MRKINSDSIISSVLFKGGKTFFEALQSRLQSQFSGVSFEEVFGDLSDANYTEDLELDNLKLTSLKGCPTEISGEFFSVQDCPHLTTFKHFPKKLPTNGYFYCDLIHVPLLADIDITSLRNLGKIYISLPKAVDSLPVKIRANIVVSFYELAKAKESYDIFLFTVNSNELNSGKPLTSSEFESLCNIYEKVGCCREKFERALELL